VSFQKESREFRRCWVEGAGVRKFFIKICSIWPAPSIETRGVAAGKKKKKGGVSENFLFFRSSLLWGWRIQRAGARKRKKRIKKK